MRASFEVFDSYAVLFAFGEGIGVADVYSTACAPPTATGIAAGVCKRGKQAISAPQKKIQISYGGIIL